VVADLQPGDVGSDFDDLARRLVSQRYRDHLATGAERPTAQVQEARIGAADAAGADPHQYVVRPRSRPVELDNVDAARWASLDRFHCELAS
jgi:hypothetical protein